MDQPPPVYLAAHLEVSFSIANLAHQILPRLLMFQTQHRHNNNSMVYILYQ